MLRVIQLVTVAILAPICFVVGYKQTSMAEVAYLYVTANGECRARVGGDPNFHTGVSRRTQGGRVTCSISFDKQGEEE